MSNIDSNETAMRCAQDFVSKGPHGLFIDGKWIPSASGKTFQASNPSTETVLTTVFEGDREDVELAVSAARAAFVSPSWQNLSAHERESLLRKVADLIEENIDELAALDTLDYGAPLYFTRMITKDAARIFRYYSGWPTKISGKTIPVSADTMVYTSREPVGVCGAIIPWNGPLWFAAMKIAPAIALGNTVIIKPAEDTSLSVIRLGKIIQEAGIPDGVVNIVTGYGRTVGAAIAEHPGIDKITFTGSTAVGQSILRSSAAHMAKVTLELGGKSPFIIFPDADIDVAVQNAVMGFTMNTGQSCTAGTRIFIHESIYDEVASKMVTMVQDISIGDGFEKNTMIGPVAHKKQFEKILSYIDVGVKEGATLFYGGKPIGERGYFITPAIFTNVQNNMRIAQEEIFGPVAALIPFKDENDAVFQGNNIPYGLASSIWTKDVSRAHRVASKIKAGTVWINTFGVFDPMLPFGGYKQSGIGREFGEESLEAYTQLKSVVLKIN